MNFATLVRRNLAYYWRTNIAVILGVATAVAVLSGALLVGDSVRASLRDLVLGRLGKTEGVVTSAQFFREALSKDVPGSAPIIAMQGIVMNDKSGRRASNVNVYGVDDRFWNFQGVPSSSGVAVSSALARELGASVGDALLLRVEKPSAIPLESLHSRKEDTGRTIRLSAGAVLDAKSLGEFSLRPTQGDVLAIFVPLRRLQRDLAQQNRVNTLLLASTTFPKDVVTLEDIGIKIRSLPDRDALSVETESGIVNDALAKKAPGTLMFAYLANSIRIGDRQIPYSLVLGVPEPEDGSTPPAESTEIDLNDWAAKDLGAKRGDAVSIDYFYWEPTGQLVTRTAQFHLRNILTMEGDVIDRDLVPQYPGITEAKNIGDWDPPFPMDLKRVRPRDEEYWTRYRTAPKAWIKLKTAQRLWGSRFGNGTTIRVNGSSDADAYAKALRADIDPLQMGMAFAAPKEQALASAKGSTDFGEYFTYFSFFLVVSALLLAGLFFQLGIEQRLREIGTLRALGFAASQIRRIFLVEGLVLSLFGTLFGTVAAVGYAAFLMYGLRTWWRGAVGTGLLTLHVSAQSLIYGAIGGMVVAWLCILLTLRSLRRASARDLLGGSHGVDAEPKRRTRLLYIVAIVSAVNGLAMMGAAIAKSLSNAEGFFGAGSLLLIAGISFEWARLRAQRGEVSSVGTLGIRNATHKPGRSVLSIALIASAVFLVVALDAFRRPAASMKGFPFYAESQLPILWDLNTQAGRENLNIQSITDAKFYAFRLRPGDDASCLNLYEPRTPRVLGAPVGYLPQIETKDPKAPIAAAADANSLTYVLHKKVGDEIDVNGVKLRIVAALEDSIFQSELIISESNFEKAFPSEQGHRVFLIDGPPGTDTKLEAALSDYGFDVTSTSDKLAAYHRVENTYLSTFQALGGLGLLLGTLGLGAVLLRNVLERRKELALLRAVGYRPEHLRKMVIVENAFLLIAGTLMGAICAFIAIAPAFFERGGHLPNPSLALLLLAVPAAGMVASLTAVRIISKAPLLETLRAE
jgi:putative ABC transport system permease protein